MTRIAIAAWTAIGVTACGNSHRGELAENAAFDCRDRTASYVAIGSLVAAELGVMLDCRDAGPRIVRWTVTKDGTRDEHTASIAVGEFDQLWKKLEGAGWRYLADCDGTGDPNDPTYSFDVNDWNGHAAFACQSGSPLPFPYHILVDELDVTASNHAATDASNRRGSDDP